MEFLKSVVPAWLSGGLCIVITFSAWQGHAVIYRPESSEVTNEPAKVYTDARGSYTLDYYIDPQNGQSGRTYLKPGQVSGAKMDGAIVKSRMVRLSRIAAEQMDVTRNTWLRNQDANSGRAEIEARNKARAREREAAAQAQFEARWASLPKNPPPPPPAHQSHRYSQPYLPEPSSPVELMYAPLPSPDLTKDPVRIARWKQLKENALADLTELQSKIGHLSKPQIKEVLEGARYTVAFLKERYAGINSRHDANFSDFDFNKTFSFMPTGNIKDDRTNLWRMIEISKHVVKDLPVPVGYMFEMPAHLYTVVTQRPLMTVDTNVGPAFVQHNKTVMAALSEVVNAHTGVDPEIKQIMTQLKDPAKYSCLRWYKK